MSTIELENKEILSETEFLEFVSKYRNEYFAYANNALTDKTLVEDVFSSAIMTAWEKRETFKVGTNLRAWVYKILINKCFVANRHSNRNCVDIDEIDESLLKVKHKEWHQFHPEASWVQESISDELTTAMESLSHAERSCLLLFSIEKYSYKKISRMLSIPSITVMTHLNRGRAKLRNLLADHALREGIIHGYN